MLGKTSRTIGALAAMGLVVAGIVATSGSPSGAVEPPLATPSAVTRTLTLNLFSDRTGVVKLVFNGVDGPETISQKITSGSACPKLEVGPLTGGTGSFNRNTTLLDFSTIVNDVQGAPGDTVQIPGNFMGVNSGTNCGVPAGLVGVGEQLKVQLGTYFNLREVEASSASVAIRRTKGDDSQLKLRFITAPALPARSTPLPALPESFEVIDGAREIPMGTVGTNTVNTEGVERPPVDGFYGVVLGSTSLSNNRGLSLTSTTTFQLTNLVSNTLYDTFCEEQIVATDTTTNAIVTSAKFFRLPNDLKQGNSPCQDVQATVQILSSVTAATTGAVFWDNTRVGVGTGGVAQAVRGLVTIEWAPVAQSATLVRQIDYDGPTGPAQFTNSLWCESFVGGVNPIGVLPFYDGPGFVSVDPDGAGPALSQKKAPWCLVSDSRVLQGDGKIKQTEVLFGSGDPLRK